LALLNLAKIVTVRLIFLPLPQFAGLPFTFVPDLALKSDAAGLIRRQGLVFDFAFSGQDPESRSA